MRSRNMYQDLCRTALIVTVFLLVIGMVNALPTIDSFYPSTTQISIIEPEDQLFNITYSPTNASVIWYKDGTQVATSDSYTFNGGYGSAGTYNITATVISESIVTSHTWNLIVSDTDSTPPRIISHSPSGTLNTKYIVLNIITDEDAICKYSTDDTDYSNMQDTLTGTELEHTLSLTKTSGNYNYYVRCIDNNNNYMTTSELISFVIDIAPHATIDLDGSSPYGAGTYKVTLLSTKNLQSQPTLYFIIDGSTQQKTISLSGENSLWEGYMIIPDDNQEQVARFYYSGIDMEGNIGTKIDTGEIFLIDTLKPKTIESIKAEQEDGEIFLEWYSDEDVDDYNIYRSTTKGVTKNDFYKTTSSTKYDDSNVDLGETYYYKISAVDEAGNEGDLSSEVDSQVPIIKTEEKTIEEEVIVEEKEIEKLSPALTPLVNNTLKNIEKKIFDVEIAIQDLQNIDEYPEKDVIKDLDLLTSSKMQKASLESLKNEVNTYYGIDLTEDELIKRIDKILVKIQKAEKLTPKEISILGQTEFSVIPTEMEIKDAIDDFLIGSNLTEKEKKNYIKENINLKNQVEIKNKITSVEIVYLNEEVQNKTLIIKEISSKGTAVLEDVNLIETIPKTIEKKAGDIDFKTEVTSILEEDPVVSWSFSRLDYEKQTIIYVINKKVTSEDAKKIVSVILKEPETKQQNTNEITGLIAFNGQGGIKLEYLTVLFGIIIVLCLLGYYVVSRNTIKQPEVSSRDLLISRANHLIDNSNYEKAVRMYKEIGMQQNASVILPNHLESIKTLRQKIELYKNIQLAHNYSLMNNSPLLREALIKIQNSYNTLLYKERKTTPLLFYTRQQYLHYSSVYKFLK